VSKQIAKLRQEVQKGERERRGSRRAHGVKKIADLLVFLIGPPHSGKSEFLQRWTGVEGRKGMGIADVGGMKVQVVELPSVVPGVKGRSQPVMPDAVIVFVTKDFPDAESLVACYGPYMLKIPRVVVSSEVPGNASLKSAPVVGQVEKALVEGLDVKRIYLKSPQQKEPDKKPMIFRGEVTVGDVATLIHKSLAENFKYARVWGSVNYQGEKVGKSYKLSDGDIVEIHRGR